MQSQRYRFIGTHEELYHLTGSAEKARILRQFIYWAVRTKDVQQFLEEIAQKDKHNDIEDSPAGRLCENHNFGWIFKKTSELKWEIMSDLSEVSLRRKLKSLISEQWLSERQNPYYAWDRTVQYRVNFAKIERDLNDLGYSLSTVMGRDFPIVKEALSNLHSEDSNLHDEDSNQHIEDSNLHNEAAIPEITNQRSLNKDHTQNAREKNEDLKTENRREAKAQKEVNQNGNWAKAHQAEQTKPNSHHSAWQNTETDQEGDFSESQKNTTTREKSETIGGDPHFPVPRSIEYERKRGFDNSIGNGPFESVSQMNEFRDALIEFGKESRKRNPGGFAQHIINQMTQSGYRHPYFEEWLAGNQIGEHERRKWEELPGKPLPHFVGYLQEHFKRNECSDVEALEKAMRVIQNPQKASQFYEQFKQSVYNEAEEIKRLKQLGVQGIVPSKHFRQQYVSTEQAIESAKVIEQESHQLNGMPSSQSSLEATASNQNSGQQDTNQENYPIESRKLTEQENQSNQDAKSIQKTNSEPEPESNIDPVEVVERELSDPEDLERKLNSGLGNFLLEKLEEAIAQGTSEQQSECWQMLINNPLTQEWAKQRMEALEYDF